MRKSLLLAITAAAVVLAAAPASRRSTAAGTGARTAPADLVLLNGNVITVDPRDRVAQAVAITADKIVAVGTNAEIRALIGPSTQQVDLKGLTVTPGLLDAHAHFASGGVNRLFTLDLSYPEVKNLADVRAKLAERVARAAPGDWVDGRGWDEGKLDERRYIRATDIDPVSPNNPVRLTQTTGHYVVVNTVALKLANITKDTPDPPGGTIDRYPDGTPTGVLKEGASGLARGRGGRGSGMPADATEQGIRELARAFNAEGMTGAKDPGIAQDTWDAYKRVLAAGGLTVRIFALWRGGSSPSRGKDLIAQVGSFTKPYESTGDDHLVSGGIKLYIDGSGGARTAWLYDDWNKDFTGTDAGNKGYPTSSPDSIRALIRMFHDAGLHVAVHSIGDHGIDWVVDSYAEAEKVNPKPGLRHSIIHANIPSDHAIAVMADLQKRFDAGYPEPSATFTWWIGDTYAGNFGPTRSVRLNPFRTFVSKGMTWANGSDYNVTPFPARYAIWSAVAREPLLGVYGKQPFGTAESVDVHTALKAVTIWAARQMFLEKKIGSLEVGKYADIAVWDRDLYRVPTAQLKDLECQMTIFNGRVVFKRQGGKL
ncbi:MAG: amidohydrolase [Gemmatimonadales bacterium]